MGLISQDEEDAYGFKKDNTILDIEEIKILLDEYYKKVVLPSRINN